MRGYVMTAGVAAAMLMGAQADAKGCLKGAAVGGVAGHYAHHHAVLGAAAGCAIGHHRAKVAARQRAAEQRQAGR
ncbi:hypothetical protein [Sphingomonas bacterium]|uniref:hypothetical protein n=1 Tax=Sphingomonas bacterium TaxID=1895847 RepID=UPI001576E997|nr:hypothetical protein [Sphingomonas bacterium]